MTAPARPNFAIALFGLILAGCRGSGPRIDSTLATLIPPDTVALVGVRMDQLRATPLCRKLAGRNLLRGDRFRAEAGIDLERDVTELLLAYDGRRSLWIARGDFRSGNNSQDGALAFLDRRIALAGPPPTVRAAIAQYRSSHHHAPAALLARVEALPRDTQIWAVASGWPGLPPAALDEMGNAANLDRVLRAVASASFSASFQAGVHATAEADCRTAPEAATLAENLRGLASLARLGLPKNEPELQRAYEAIQVRQDGRSIKLSIDFPPDLAERIADLWR